MRLSLGWLFFLLSTFALAQTSSAPAGRTICPTLQPRFKKLVQPVYPHLAATARLQGRVVLNILVNKQGIPAQITTIEGHPVLAEAAIAAVKQWRYRPLLLNRNPVETQERAEFHFLLDGKREIKGQRR